MYMCAVHPQTLISLNLLDYFHKLDYNIVDSQQTSSISQKLRFLQVILQKPGGGCASTLKWLWRFNQLKGRTLIHHTEATEHLILNSISHHKLCAMWRVTRTKVGIFSQQFKLFKFDMLLLT